MITMTIAQAATLSGAVLDAGEKATPILSVGIDSRTLEPGALFVALPGTRDGHEFLEDALSVGAVAALVRRDAFVPAGLAALRVDAPSDAFTMLARNVRKRLQARVVAITGSAGKTCTKDFIAEVLSGRFNVAASYQSFNNEIGVPLTICSASESSQVLVAEVGARGAGHIASLMPVLQPHIGVVTNVGSAHVGMFGSVEAIAQAKTEIVATLPADGVAVLNADDDRVLAMAAATKAETVFYGLSPAAAVRAEGITLDDHARPQFTLITPKGTARVHLPVPGEHMVWNALAAAAVAYHFDIGPSDVAERLRTATTSPHRMRIIEAQGGWRVIDDSYNASPASVAAALKTLAAMGRGHRTWAVLGPMAELGDSSTGEHDRLGRLAVRLGIGKIITVGEDARALHEAARLEGTPPEDVLLVADAEAAAKTVLQDVEPGDVVLVKGSRVAGLERVVEAIA